MLTTREYLLSMTVGAFLRFLREAKRLHNSGMTWVEVDEEMDLPKFARGRRASKDACQSRKLSRLAV